MSGRALIRVQVVLSIEVRDAWGDDCTIGQVKNQGMQAATQKLRGLIAGSGVKVVSIGDPLVVLGGDP